MPSPNVTSTDSVETTTRYRIPRWLLIVMTVFAVACLSYAFVVFQVARAAVGAMPFVGFDERYFWWPFCAGVSSLFAIGIGVSANWVRRRRNEGGRS